MQPRRRIIAALAWVACVVPAGLGADVALPKILGDNMVLQRGCAVPVWGTAAPGEAVNVAFAGQHAHTIADASGRWQVQLAPLDASAEPRELTITANNTLHLKNVLVGEVWLCGGQSNMEYAVDRTTAGAPPATKSDAALAAEIKSAQYPLIRLFRVQKKLAPPDVVSDGWTDCGGDNLAIFSAIGFFFARDLQQALGVPVGVIQSAWGGSRIEPWTPPAAYAASAVFKAQAAAKTPMQIDDYPAGKYVDGMIRPLAPYALRGVLWYQGESNIIATNDGVRYADKFQVLVDGWRALWKNPALPFYSVQLAPFYYTKRKDPLAHSAEELPKLWEAQYLALRIPHTGLVATLDLDANFGNIHPNGKRVVGRRLADLALTQTYGKSGLVYSGPTFAKMAISGNTAVLRFDNLAGGLASRDRQPLTEFEIAGADGQFVPATAIIRGDTVVVSAASVAAPAAVRFAWRETAQPNLINTAGLPAYPFRTNGPVWQPAVPQG
jgi:sialate O-acetylesterase